MSLSELQRTTHGPSIRNRRRGHKANQTQLENLKKLNHAISAIGSALSAYESFQIETYGGIVERTVLRTPLREDLGAPEEIPFAKAAFELSGWAQVEKTANTEFEGREGKQVRYLLTLDDTFMFPSFHGALAELLDAEVEIRTKLAVYRLATRIVKPRIS
jgi:hypothetical protein